MPVADILVVDDETNVQLILQQLLERNGHWCMTAENATVARMRLQQQPFDLLISDIKMPGETGISLVADVKQRYPDMACMFLSGIDDSETTQEAIDLGVSGYLLKPFSTKTVLIGVANALHARSLELENRSYRENLELQVEQRTRSLQKTIHRLEATERQLTHSHEEYRHLVMSLPSIVYRGFPDWSVDFVGDKIEEVTGYSRADFDSRKLKWSDIVHEDDLEATRLTTLQAVKNRDTFLREYRIRHRDGHILWIQDRGQPIYGEDGLTAYIHGVALDVTKEKEAENQLTLARQEMQQLLDAISGVLITIDADHHVKRWNTVAQRVFGMAAETVLGKPLAACQLPWDWEQVSAGLSRCRQEEEPVRVEDVRFERSDGTQGFLGITVNPIKAEPGKVSGLLIMAADITERKLLEGQLHQAQKLESIGQLAAGIAHEINTPTQYVGDNIRFLKDSSGDLFDLLEKYQGAAEAVRAGTAWQDMLEEISEFTDEIDLEYLADEVPKAIEQSIDGIERVAKIVLAMKEFSHPGVDEKKLIDINKAIESTITVSRNEWKYVADLETNLDRGLPLVPCLAGELNQVFLNIIVNAAHAIGANAPQDPESKGKISITTGQTGDWFEVRISDTGCGIPESIKHRIFDPFFTTKDVGKGTGQGLAIAHDVVVNKHRGSLVVETKVGQGTTFLIQLPMDDPDEAKDEIQ